MLLSLPPVKPFTPTKTITKKTLIKEASQLYRKSHVTG